jgi:hypothetical protein
VRGPGLKESDFLFDPLPLIGTKRQFARQILFADPMNNNDSILSAINPGDAVCIEELALMFEEFDH